MYRSTEMMKDVVIRTSDDISGKIEQFYFDNNNWAIRYIVIVTGSLLSKERKLLSPLAVQSIGPDGVLVNITAAQLRRSPDIDTEQPVSRQKEQEIHTHYRWPYYWDDPNYASKFGTDLYPGSNVNQNAPDDIERYNEKSRKQDMERECEPQKSCLRSTKEVTGYTVVAQDMEMGSVKDFLFDDEKWILRFIILETGSILSRKKIILASQWSQKIEWRTNRTYFDINPTIIEQGPRYESGMPISREFESRLFDYYHKPYNW